MSKNINTLIGELISYGMAEGLVDPADQVCLTNRLLEILGLQ